MSTPAQNKAINRLQAIGAQVEGKERTHFFDEVKKAPPNAIFHTKTMYASDPDPRKINLGIGAYRTNVGKPYILSCVLKAEQRILADKTINHEYLPIAGDKEFANAAARLMFGSEICDEGRLASRQCLSGTGSLRIGFDFVKKVMPETVVYLSNPTWGNHKQLVKAAGLTHRSYSYWNPEARSLDIDGLLADLRAAPKRSTILLHACAHNPTGVDPTRKEWKRIAEVCKERNHLPYFDCAYQGFATGNIENDAWPVRYFCEQGFELLCAQSFAKNFGLYNERVGAVHVYCGSMKEAIAVGTQIDPLIRSNYSNPPAHGARIVKCVLNDRNLFAEWQGEVKIMSARIMTCRSLLYAQLKKLKTPGTWEHIITQIGMFTFTGLSPKQVEVIMKKHHVYMLRSGRISMAGINTGNVEYLAEAIDDVVRNVI